MSVLDNKAVMRVFHYHYTYDGFNRASLQLEVTAKRNSVPFRAVISLVDAPYDTPETRLNFMQSVTEKLKKPQGIVTVAIMEVLNHLYHNEGGDERLLKVTYHQSDDMPDFTTTEWLPERDYHFQIESLPAATIGKKK